MLTSRKLSHHETTIPYRSGRTFAHCMQRIKLRTSTLNDEQHGHIDDIQQRQEHELHNDKRGTN